MYNSHVSVGAIAWRSCILAALLLAAWPSDAQGTREDWPSYGGLWNAWRHSELDQVNVDNVRRLTAVWAFQAEDGAEGLQATPIVRAGVLYLSTSSNLIYALDAASGDVLWKYDARPGPPGVYRKQNRGVAVGHGLVFMGTIDNRLVAVDRETGRDVWQVQVQDPKQCGCSITGAPLLVKDKIVVGGTGGDLAYRGSISAFDAKTGAFAWRFYITPAPGEPGNETWEGDSWRYGGGAPWMTGSYDAELDLIYWGTGNAAPDMDGEARRGDNLYTASVVALSPGTGELAWHYQEVPHDVWDYDSAYEVILVDLPVAGRPRKLLLHPTKAGYTWVLDRTNGEFVAAWPMVETTWVAGITEDGTLVGRVEPAPGKPVKVCPSVGGGKSWNQAAFSPLTGLIYIPTANGCSFLHVRSQKPVPGKGYIGGFWKGAPASADNYSALVAFDPLTGEKRWELPYKYMLLSSILSTAGGLLFYGDAEGRFLARDARTGESLWSFQTGAGHRGSSVTYAVDGRQYIATPSGWGSMAAGGRARYPELRMLSSKTATVFAFALPED